MGGPVGTRDDLMAGQFDPTAVPDPIAGREPEDSWIHRSYHMRCRTCMWYCPKVSESDVPTVKVGRCRRHAPTMSGWPVMKPQDWCGDHKLDETK